MFKEEPQNLLTPTSVQKTWVRGAPAVTCFLESEFPPPMLDHCPTWLVFPRPACSQCLGLEESPCGFTTAWADQMLQRHKRLTLTPLASGLREGVKVHCEAS